MFSINHLLSGKHTKNYGKSPCWMGNLTISMAMFQFANCWHNQRVFFYVGTQWLDPYPYGLARKWANKILSTAWSSVSLWSLLLNSGALGVLPVYLFSNTPKCQIVGYISPIPSNDAYIHIYPAKQSDPRVYYYRVARKKRIVDLRSRPSCCLDMEVS